MVHSCTTYIPTPRSKGAILCIHMQERYRKDIQRVSGVFQVRFAVVKGPTRFWDKRVLPDIVTVYVILHNMTVEDECKEEPSDIDSTQPSNAKEIEGDDAERFKRFLARHKKIQY